MAAWRRDLGHAYSLAMSVLCNECSSDMVFRDGLWQCDNCFNVLILEDIGSAPIEDGLTMDDVMKQYEDK